MRIAYLWGLTLCLGIFVPSSTSEAGPFHWAKKYFGYSSASRCNVCPDDYCRKPLPAPPCPGPKCCDDYCPHLEPCVLPLPKSCCPDCYCPKPLPCPPQCCEPWYQCVVNCRPAVAPCEPAQPQPTQPEKTPSEPTPPPAVPAVSAGTGVPALAGPDRPVIRAPAQSEIQTR